MSTNNSLTATCTVYREILCERFPGIVVCIDPYMGKHDGGTLGVFCIPDDKAEEYMEFMLDEFQDILDEHGLPELSVLPRTESTTKEYYPEIWKSWKLKQGTLK